MAIGTEDSDGAKHWIASGVNYAKSLGDGRYIPCLVTNRHVIEGLGSGYVRANPKAGGSAVEAHIIFRDEDGLPAWYPHPDPEVDIAVTPVDAKALLETHDLDLHFFRGDVDSITLEGMRDRQLSEGDGVFVLGFPMGIVGDERSRVIARGGWVARIQDTLAGTATAFLVDASVFPGNSGGAVVLKPELASVRDEPISQSLLAGIVAAYVPYRDVAVSQQTNQPRVIFEENSGLVMVYPVDCIEEAINAIPLEDGDEALPAAAVEQVPPGEVSHTLEEPPA